jgi:DNA repair protein RadA
MIHSDSQDTDDARSSHVNVPNGIPTTSAHHENSRQSLERISTGSKKVDEILCGGIETKAVTQFYGESGSGKTQLCHTLCAIVPQHKSKGGACGKSIYIDTEGTFRPQRIEEIAKARGFDLDMTIKNTVFEYAMDSLQQEQLIKNINSSLANVKDSKERKFKLVVVDSPIAHYRAEYLGRAMLPQRQQRLYRFMHSLKEIAYRYRIAVVVTNQVNTSPNSNTSYSHKPVGGHVMAHSVTYAVRLQSTNDGFIHTARIVVSPYHPPEKAYFAINKNGLTDFGS